MGMSQADGNPAMEELVGMMSGPPQGGMPPGGMPPPPRAMPQGGPPPGGMPPPPQAPPQTPSMSSLLQMIQTREAERPSLEQQQMALRQYIEAVRNSQPLDDNPFYSMGRGFLAAPAGHNGIDNMLSGFEGAGKEIVARNELARQDRRTRDVGAAKIEYDDTIKRRDEVDKSIGPMLRGAYGKQGGMTPTIKVVDGKLIKYDPATNQTEVLSGTRDQMAVSLFKIFVAKAIEEQMPNPEAYAKNATENALSALPGMSVTGTTNGIPGTRTVGQPANPQPAAAPSAPPDRSAESLEEELKVVREKMVEVQSNPKMPDEVKRTAFGDLMQIEKQLVTRIQAAKGVTAPTAPTAPATIQYDDKAKKAMEKGTAAQTGTDLGKEHSNLNAGLAASGKMITQLDMLEQLYSTPGIPEGELADRVQAVRSGLASLGVPVEKSVGAADMARAIATNFALHLRTGEGSNLMPGQMSNYEDQLLQRMSPVLSLTTDGRVALIQFMREASQSNMRIANEANKMAQANRGILPSDWYVRRERVMKEEMLRLAKKNKEIMSRFQGEQ